MPAENQPEDHFMTTQELMKFLGLSRTKIWSLINSEGLPAFKVGGDYRYRMSEVVQWMENYRVKEMEKKQSPEK